MKTSLQDILNVTTIANVPDPDAPSDLKAQLVDQLIKATYPANRLDEVDLPNRERIIGDWLMQGDLGFIYGPRGLGKTWLGLHLARKIAEGGSVAMWGVQKPRRVLYVDGEMPFDDIRKRNAALSTANTDGLLYLQHEALFHFTGQVLNLTNPLFQEALLELCKKEEIEVLALDNLSCLFTGINENDADAWEKVLPWLLDLRRARITVMFIAHAGRNGLMRGTSRREDAAFWIIRLDEVKELGEQREGAAFTARFVKNRNPKKEEPSLEWRFTPSAPDGAVVAHWQTLSPTDLLRQCIEDGLTTATDIAEEMEISKGLVSRLAARSMKEGWLRKDGRDYAIVEKR